MHFNDLNFNLNQLSYLVRAWWFANSFHANGSCISSNLAGTNWLYLWDINPRFYEGTQSSASIWLQAGIIWIVFAFFMVFKFFLSLWLITLVVFHWINMSLFWARTFIALKLGLMGDWINRFYHLIVSFTFSKTKLHSLYCFPMLHR